MCALHYPSIKTTSCRISSVCLQSQRSWEITRTDQRIWKNHSVVCGPLALRRVTAWLDFPLSGAILRNVTDTSLKQHCHSVLSGSIFSYWHFPVCEDCVAYQENETSDGIFSLLFPAGKKGRRGRGKKCFLTLTETRSGLSLQGTDCNSVLIQGILQRDTQND